MLFFVLIIVICSWFVGLLAEIRIAASVKSVGQFEFLMMLFSREFRESIVCRLDDPGKREKLRRWMLVFRVSVYTFVAGCLTSILVSLIIARWMTV